MNDYFVLDGKEVKPVFDVMEWAAKFDKDNRQVDLTRIGDVKISTVFLGLNHAFDNGAPLVFETMIFGGEHDQYQDRYSTWDEAVEGHKAACELVSKPVTPKT